MSDNTKLIEAIKDAENAIAKALAVLKAIASEQNISNKDKKGSYNNEHFSKRIFRYFRRGRDGN